MQSRKSSSQWRYLFAFWSVFSLLIAPVARAQEQMPSSRETAEPSITSTHENTEPVDHELGVDESFYFYASGHRVPLDLSTESIMVRFLGSNSPTSIESHSRIRADFELLPYAEGNSYLISLEEGLGTTDVLTLIDDLGKDPAVELASPVFRHESEALILTDQLVVKLVPSASSEQIEGLIDSTLMEVVRHESAPSRDILVLKVKPNSGASALDLANQLHEDPLTLWASPDFLLKLVSLANPPSDQYFEQQWVLEKIKASDAWNIEMGWLASFVAVLDDGVDIGHSEFVSKIVAPRDFVPLILDDDPSPGPDDNHGTAVAGIAVAPDDGEGVVGVCPGCSLMPVRVPLDGWTAALRVSDAIIWAADHGADAINMSWGTSTDNQIVHDAIIYAASNGAGGIGSVLVAGTGNTGGDVYYPARFPEVIGVGSSDPSDEQWYYTNDGDGLDVLAPSGSHLDGDVWTTDIRGEDGYNDGDEALGDVQGDYFSHFGGTSGAAPVVSGIVGLIRSEKPALSGVEVRRVITSTARVLTQYGDPPSHFSGWGRVDAYAALGAFSAPEITVVSPADGSSVGGSVIIQTNVITDGNPISHVEFWVDGAKIAPDDTEPPYECAWDTTGLVEGTIHYVEARAYDEATWLGYSSYGTDLIYVAVDSSAPTYSISGYVKDTNNQGIANVWISTGSQGAYTNSSGYYIVSGLAEGVYMVTPTKPGYTFTPSSVEVNLTYNRTVNFTGTQYQSGDTFTFLATEDTYLREAVPSSTNNTSCLRAGQEYYGGSYQAVVGLLKFGALSTNPDVQGKTVYDAELRLHLSSTNGPDTRLRTWAIGTYQGVWDESTTYATFPYDSWDWYDYYGSMTGSANFDVESSDAGSWLAIRGSGSATIENYVQGIIQGDDANRGLLIDGYYSNVDSYPCFSSSEGSHPPEIWFQILTGTPDLVVSSITTTPAAGPGSTFNVGQSITIDFTVFNNGPGGADSSRAAVYLGTSTDDLSYKLDDEGIGQLLAGEEDDDYVNYVFSASDVGTRYIVVRADDEVDVSETDEGNNVSWIGPFQIVQLNQPPVISGLPDRTLDEDDYLDNTIDLWALASDETPDNGLSFSINNSPDPEAGIQIDANRYVDIEPATNWCGGTDVEIRVADPQGLSDTDTFHVTVNCVNDLPWIAPRVEDQFNDVDVPIIIDLTAYEHDIEESGTSLDWYVTGEDNCTVSGAYSDEDMLSFTPFPGFEGSDTVTLHLTDSEAAETTQDVTFTWIRPNTPPTLSWVGDPGYESDGLDPESGYSETTFTYRVEYSDGEGDPPNYVRVHIVKDGVELAGSPFELSYVSGDYSAGATYSYSPSGLDANAEYSYFFDARDSYDADAVATGAQSGPIVYGITHTPITSAVEGTSIPITATVTSATTPLTVTLSYRVAGDSIFEDTPMANTSGDLYEGTIPSTTVTAAGVDYHISATDGTFTTTHPTVGYHQIDVLTFCDTVTEVPKAECEALVSLYESTDGPTWTNSNGWLDTNTPCTDWHGVTCLAGHVSQLDLHSNQLSGNIPPDLGSLVDLATLSLYINQLSGNIPPELGGLTSLQFLYLYGNQLSGNIPLELGGLTNLQSLALDYNQLSGNIPPELGSLASLGHLSLSSNQLSGNIPPELGDLADLAHLSLDYNQLSGNIPPELGNLAKLLILLLHYNELTGSIPPELGGLAELQILCLNSNQLSGNIPPELGGLANLLNLSLDRNQLSGSIPPELGSWLNLEHLNLTGNQLTGSIPPELGNLSVLQDLDLSFNQLTGSIPPGLGGLGNLWYLNLHGNRLSGNLPPELGDLSTLQTLYLSANQFTSTVPAELGDLVNLQRLELQFNALEGDVPASIAGLVNLDPASTNLGFNMLTASDPGAIAFLNEKDPDWADTQTVPPAGLQATDFTASSVQLDWTPINYVSDAGYYEVSYATSPGGPYSAHGTTADTAMSSYVADDLSPEATYYFVVRSYTPANGYQQNELWSWYSEEVSATTAAEPVTGLVTANSSPTLLGSATWLTATITAGSNIGYTWDFGDGALGSGKEIRHTYPEVGVYTAVVTASNSVSSLTATTVVTITERTFCDDVSEIPKVECEALVALHDSTDGSNWSNNAGWLETNTPCVDWYGVTCTTGHVSHLELTGNQLTGSIPPELGGLAELQILCLNSNQLSGNIPPELGGLANLQQLSLNFNQLSGSIPPELGALANLGLLDLFGNQLTGNIPPELSGLANLLNLSLDRNQLSGSIPPELGSLVNLQLLSLFNNQLSGNIPPELGSLTSLLYLSLGGNQLSGSIPSELGNLANLWYLHLSINQLTGNIPPELGNLASLQYLYLLSNQLTGEIPPELGGLDNLRDLHLNNNQLSGSIPPQLGSLNELQILQLQNNALAGEIPASIINLTGLSPYEGLDLGYNMLTASDPAVLAFLNKKDPNWADTQTVAPANLQVGGISDASLQLTWEPITYTWDSGYYEVGFSTLPGGPYTVHGTTPDKTAVGYLADGLSPNTEYYFVVRTHTPAHNEQQNDLLSGYTEEVSATSEAGCLARINGDATVYGDVQSAVDAAGVGDLVKVAGYCAGVQSRAGVTQTVYLSKTLTIQGGYTTTNWIAPDPGSNPTTLDAQGLGRVLYITGEISPTIEGLHITGGDAREGGGIYVSRASATISNSSVYSNTATYGGGFFLVSSPATIDANTVSGNTARDWAGGIFLQASNADLSNNVISDNTALGDAAGGLCLRDSDATLIDNVISSNQTLISGGAVYVESSDIVIRGNVLQANAANAIFLWESDALLDANYITGSLMGVFMHASSPLMTNNVIAGNSGIGVSVEGAWPRLLNNTLAQNSEGLRVSDRWQEGTYYTSTVVLTNTILSDQTSGVSVDSGNKISLEGTLWYGNSSNWSGEGTIITGTVNIFADPEFMDAASGDYHIQPTSPAVDAGVPTAIGADMDGEARPFGAGPDIGADEWATAQVNVEPATAATLVVTVDGLPTTIDFPAGSVTDTTAVEYTALASVLEDVPADFAFAGHAFGLDAYRDGLTLPGLPFVVPVTVTLEYSDGDVAALDEATLVLEWWTGSGWEDAACGPYDRNLAENWLSVPICHLSQFGLFGRTTASKIYLPLVQRNWP